ncbi:hypothetical protein CS022_11195 [Veronia nyctiphanis]|uniref:Uncharacterized protein n=1 Tax=Veronia nyctiphanis TaxID=1278244 RepID=A0A4Q0YW92_9GAMM|nr:hypothetical protein [Veronia nyctiphanis]RXJ73281.1 hypothetical protein CS022_11195 [Veronia nyctiphanis]
MITNNTESQLISSVAHIKAKWSINGYLKKTDWNNLHQKHPARNFERVLQLLSSDVKNKVVRFGDSNTAFYSKYEYSKISQNEIGRKLIEVYPKPAYQTESWQLFVTNVADMTSIESMYYTVSQGQANLGDGRFTQPVDAEMKLSRISVDPKQLQFNLDGNRLANAEIERLILHTTKRQIASMNSIEDVANKLDIALNNYDINALAGLPQYLFENFSYDEIIQYIDSLTDEQQSALFGALGEFQHQDTEPFLSKIINDANARYSNVFRSVFAMGSLKEPTHISVEALGYLSNDFSTEELSLNYNSLVQLGRLFGKVDKQQHDVIKESIEKFQASTELNSQDKQQIVFHAMAATNSPDYLQPTIEQIQYTGDKALDRYTRAAAVKVITNQASIGNIEALQTIKTMISTEAQSEVLESLTEVFHNKSLPDEVRENLISRADDPESKDLKQTILLVLAGTPERCKNNHNYLLSNMSELPNETINLIQGLCQNL